MPFSTADAIFWVAVACCAIAQLAILRSVMVSPARAGERVGASVTRRAVEIGWALLPGVVLAVVFVYTWRAIHAPNAAATATLAVMMQ